jgi:hypothetical protein
LRRPALEWAAGLTPVKAVPAKAHAKGSRYQGEMEIAYRASDMDTIEIPTALHAFHMLSSNTCAAWSHVWCSSCIYGVVEWQWLEIELDRGGMGYSVSLMAGMLVASRMRFQQRTSGGIVLTMSARVMPSGRVLPMVV